MVEGLGMLLAGGAEADAALRWARKIEATPPDEEEHIEYTLRHDKYFNLRVQPTEQQIARDVGSFPFPLTMAPPLEE